MGSMRTVSNKRLVLLALVGLMSAIAVASGWHHHESGSDGCLACALVASAAILVAVAYSLPVLAPVPAPRPAAKPRTDLWPPTPVCTRGPPR